MCACVCACVCVCVSVCVQVFQGLWCKLCVCECLRVCVEAGAPWSLAGRSVIGYPFDVEAPLRAEEDQHMSVWLGPQH